MDERRRPRRSGGIGVGYVSLIMLFAVITLTVLAVLSYQAASANDTLNDRSVSFGKEYYAADGRAKEMLMKLDECAVSAHESGFFEDAFAEYCEELEGVSLKRLPGGISVHYSENLNERTELVVNIMFYSDPQAQSRYDIEMWKTVPASSDDESDDLGVWDGSGF
ncbi:MAG: hypothetical protein IJZ95_05290 [Oscillospiraceae bacterium]|nr:hypothetical protein [Oscillospiraceae bacterium]